MNVRRVQFATLLCALLLVASCRSDPTPGFSETDFHEKEGVTPPAYHQPLADWRREHMVFTARGRARDGRIFSVEGCRDCHAPETFCNRCHAFVGAPLMGD